MRFEAPPVPDVKHRDGGFWGNVLRGIAFAVNNLDERNFPNQLDASKIIKPGTITLAALGIHELTIPLVMNGTAFATTSTTPVDASGYFTWNPANYPSGSWFFEATLYSDNASATATAFLHGSADFASVTNAGPTVAIKRVAVTMPSTAQNLWVRLSTSSATYNARLLNARLVFTQ